MSISTLPPETIEHILEYLSSSINDLFPSALVNRSWCTIVIPILWRNPFQLASELQTCKLRYKSLVNTYFHTSDEKLQKFLHGQYLDHNALLSFIKIQVTEQSGFRYASFLKTIHTKYIYKAIYAWIEYLQPEDDIDMLTKIFYHEFFHHLWNESPVIQDLIITDCNKSPLYFWTPSRAAECLSKISSLYIYLDETFPTKIFSFLVSNCHYWPLTILRKKMTFMWQQ